MKVVKWVVAKLQGDKKTASCWRVTNPHPGLPWNFMTHGFLDPSAFPDKTTTGDGRTDRQTDARTDRRHSSNTKHSSSHQLFICSGVVGARRHGLNGAFGVSKFPVDLLSPALSLRFCCCDGLPALYGRVQELAGVTP